MFGPLTLIARDPLVLLLLALAVLGGVTLHTVAQAHLARRLGDPAAYEAGFTSLEPPVHHSLVSLLLYLTLGLALPRPVPLHLQGWRAAATLLSGPLTLLLTALALLLLQRLQQLSLSGFDLLGQALGRAAYSLTQHGVFFLLPLPSLELGRALLFAGPPALRRGLGLLVSAGPLLAYIFWLLLALSGGLSWATAPFWRLLSAAVGLLP